MSRTGKKPIVVPSGVRVEIAQGAVTAKGPKGEGREPLPRAVTAALVEGQIRIAADLKAGKDISALYGLTRARVNNLVQGVAVGYSKVLEIAGLGFRAEAAGQKLTFSLGKSHPVLFDVPAGVAVAVDPKKTTLTVTGASKDLVGEIAAKIRALRPPEPYKGTGIHYKGEHIRRKAGKTAASAGAAKK
ncbi:MAG: 50S ribosomal protein L6 [Elusimicrobia bacterium]|nr:50S ribosomal protein L6 [Elusimicrobiota bacterium]MDE2312618.1 50S ribosomal protein L6 [Elusimicrobiota bacterium]